MFFLQQYYRMKFHAINMFAALIAVVNTFMARRLSHC
jgi:hypothetical protein